MQVKLLGKQLEIKTEVLVIAVSALILSGCLIGYLFFRDNSEIIIESDTDRVTAAANAEAATPGTVSQEVTVTATDNTDASRTSDSAISVAEEIKVYVVGCVKNPGIVTLVKGQLIHDAVEKAGGLTEEADAENINMVYELHGNTMLHIKSRKEQTADPNTVVLAEKKEPAKSKPGKGAVLVSDEGDSVEMAGGGKDRSTAAQEGNTGSTSLVNINTAGADELDTLPGVGEATARDIIAFREKNGPFRKIEDIMNVPRIKQGRFDSIKEFIAVE